MRFNIKSAYSLPIALFLLSQLTISWLGRYPTNVSASESILTKISEDTEPGLTLHLGEGTDTMNKTEQPLKGRITKLSPERTQQLLDRLQPLKIQIDDVNDFKLRDKSLPLPTNGKTLSTSFSTQTTPDTNPTVVPNVPLEITRYSPENLVPIAPNLSITFSQPMVPITSSENLESLKIPLIITPKPEGRWRWIGTKTLLFEPMNKFPMATEYTVEVPAGTKSFTGNTLTKTKIWKFQTPPPQITSTYPTNDQQQRNPLMFIGFDQQVNPTDIVKLIRIISGKEEWKARLATNEEIQSNQTIYNMTKSAVQGCWVAFYVDSINKFPLPAASNIIVSIGPNIPSAEGPLKTNKVNSFGFRTYDSLHINNYNCGWRKSKCSPFDTWTISFNNLLDKNKFKPDQIHISPNIQNAKIENYGSNISISGAKTGNTTYTVTLDPSISDVFGQQLGKEVSIKFEVGLAPKSLTAPEKEFVVLDPSGSANFSVYSVNHKVLKVRLYKVTPEDWPQFVGYLNSRWDNKKATLPGRLVHSATISIKWHPDELIETPIDLTPALNRQYGQILLEVEPAYHEKNDQTSIIRWIQKTQIGLDAFVDNQELVCWATSLANGKPLENVQVTMQPQAISGITRSDGLVHLPLNDSYKTNSILIARTHNDVAILPESTYWWNNSSNWIKTQPSHSLAWYVFNDRGMYRPNEEVHIKGWIRDIDYGKTGGTQFPLNEIKALTYSLKDSLGNEILSSNCKVNLLGGFDLSFKLPGTMNLGNAALSFATPAGNTFLHTFQVQEFRRPEFEVNVTTDEGPYFVGDSTTARVNATYYAGGGLDQAPTTWRVTSSQGSFSPPNWSEFTFGTWIPWWTHYYDKNAGQKTQTFSAQTDALGKHCLKINFDKVNPPRPTAVTAEATIMDVNRQAWSSSTTLLVHPANLYVGLHSERAFVQKGQPVIIKAIVTDIDGKPINGREINLKATRTDWTYENGKWQEKELDTQNCKIKSETKPVQCTFQTPEGGTYKILATIIDDKERPNQSEMTIWVSGGKHPTQTNIEQETVELIPSKKDYKDGEIAEILVQAPFAPAEGLLTVQRAGILYTERFKIESNTHTLKIPIKDTYIPNVYAQVDLIGVVQREDSQNKVNEKLPKRPAYATGSINLSVPPTSRTLKVNAVPRDFKLEPGGETIVDLTVTDSSGSAVPNSETAIVIVDESVLALTNYNLVDPLSIFYPQRSKNTTSHYLQEHILLIDPDELLNQLQGPGIGGGVGRRSFDGTLNMAAPAGMPPPSPAETMALKKKADGDSSTSTPINIRANFNALAVFAPSVLTDPNGKAQIKVKLPDNLTRYRVMAVAVANSNQFGTSESSITARMPLMVRPSAPRFLNFGDKFELPIVVQNQTDHDLEVDLAARATNVQLTEGSGRQVVVPANSRIEIRLPAATEKTGIARFQVGISSEKWSDAAEFEMPVFTPATTEVFATYGEIDNGAIVQPVTTPENIFKQFGNLEVTTSSTQLQALTDAVIYLVSYPFGCSEQISSRVLTIAALRDVLTAFKAKELPKQEEMLEAVSRDIKMLQSRQNNDGGFGLWRRDQKSWPYVSIHVAHALQRAKNKDFPVPNDMLDRAKEYLREIDKHLPEKTYGPDARKTLVAYALYVRSLMGDKDPAEARNIIKNSSIDKLPLEAVGWLLQVLADDPKSQMEVKTLHQYLNNKVTETAGTAHFVTSYSEEDGYLLFHSNRRVDGIILEALIKSQPSSDLITKIVRGLLANKTKGHWANTQEDAFILLALDKYFHTYESVTPNFVTKIWLGNSYAGDNQFAGRTTDQHRLEIPMKYLAEGAKSKNLTISKEGVGRLYYRIGINYAPTDLKLKSLDNGFTVERIYEPIDNPSDVQRDANGVWHIKAGAKVRVKLTMVAPTRRYHVALVDPLPAGLEILNPEIAVTGNVDNSESNIDRNGWWWRGSWFEHQNMRDERIEAFTSLLWKGIHSYTYTARATTPGQFVVPPSKAEEMYHPETFGRGSTDEVIIEEK